MKEILWNSGLTKQQELLKRLIQVRKNCPSEYKIDF